MVHPVKLGRSERMSYSKTKDTFEMPNLIEVQKNSFQWFLDEGLREVFKDFSPISNYRDKEDLVMEFVDYSLKDEPKYSIEECKERDTTYSAPLKVRVRLINKKTDEINEQEIFMGEFPQMTPTGTFVINGAERVIVSQLVRSPGIYFKKTLDKNGKPLFTNNIIPNRGAWIEYETDANDVMFVRIDRTRKLPVTVLLRAIGYGTDQQIIDLMGEHECLSNTLQKDDAHSVEDGLIEIYKKNRPGEPPTEDSARTLFNGMFFDYKRYDLAKVGRYKYNKKLSIASRIAGKYSASEIISPDGEILADAGKVISKEMSVEIQNAGINEVTILIEEGKELKIIGNNTVDMKSYVSFDPKEIGITEFVNFSELDKLLKSGLSEEEIKIEAEKNVARLSPKHITVEDMVASINYLICLQYGVGEEDDIDHLGNRRLRSVGELLQNQFRIGLARMERSIRERMSVQEQDIITPQGLINIRPVAASIKEFFGSSQLSQFMDQTNPLAELNNKRRLSALGPGGLSRERASFEVRDVHDSHYGRMCPIETPEGPNIGLIGSLSTYAKINEYGFIEAPYRKVDVKTHSVTEHVDYLTADVEDTFTIAQANEPLDANGRFLNKKVAARRKEKIVEAEAGEIEYMDVSPMQIVSVATAMIPFLENDDASRALMGSNMQRQAVPLIKTDSPIVGTGIEYRAAKDSGVCVVAKSDGVVFSVCAKEIIIKTEDGKTENYKMTKYVRSNQGTCINQRPIVRIGETVKAGDIIADGPSTDQGEIALGRNILMGFMTWEGYNYEDAILINETLVMNDVFSSIHIEEYECEARDTKLGAEEITREVVNVGEDTLKDLDERGIIRIGAEVRTNSILVGKVTPKGETEMTAEERLLRAIFGDKVREVRDTSLRVPHGETGIIVDVKVFTRENGDDLSPGVNKLVRVYIAQKRKISVGDKMAGRHGNKGVVSRILPKEDMPYLPDGTPLEIVLNPLGVPSRMNVGQVLEVHLGYAAKLLGWKIATPVFNGATEADVVETLKMAGIDEDGKTQLRDGRSGELFDNRVTVGCMYIMKLFHLVDDKIHARSTGPYSLVTQQPLGGKAQFGGQRFGEMEVWALEAYGAAYTLQEILTVKSDDVSGRVKTFEAIVKGNNVPEPGIPESFKVLMKELQSLSLDIKVFSDNQEEIEFKETSDDEVRRLGLNFSGRELGLDEDLTIDDPMLEDEEISEINLPSGMFIEENGEMVDVAVEEDIDLDPDSLEEIFKKDSIVFEKFDEDDEVAEDILDVVDDDDKF
ncbi:MAG: DNA-directed RNA polymerase subunit beta [Clostridia bacterium]